MHETSRFQGHWSYAYTTTPAMSTSDGPVRLRTGYRILGLTVVLSTIQITWIGSCVSVKTDKGSMRTN